MTLDDRVAAVAEHGFTQRQAAFLTTAMLHAGVCVQRQYRSFAGIAHGQVVRDFFEKLVARRFAQPYAFGRAGVHVYHVQHKALYRAIGEPDSRFRKRATVVRAVERLMVLDAVLATADLAWLATERDKVTYFVHERRLPTDVLPALRFDGATGTTHRYFPDKLPIGVSPTVDRLTLLYVVSDRTGQLFRAFLSRHEELIRRLPSWRVLLVVPPSSAAATGRHETVFRDFCAAPLRPAIVDEFKWYCGVRRGLDERSRPAEGESDRYARARRAFGSPRFYAAYRRWCSQGDSSLLRLQSPGLHETWQRGAASLEILTLEHGYGEPVSLAQTA